MPTKEKTTDELLNEIQNSREIEKFIEQNSSEFADAPLHEHICDIIKEKELKKSKVVAGAGLNRIYGYQILAGKRMPSRDKLIALGFGLHLKLDEMNDLLRYGGYSPLYARNKRDAVIIFALANGKSIFIANEMLFDNGFEILTA